MTTKPFTVRASSWAALFDCAHKWEGVHLLGMRSPSTARAVLGRAIHHGTALFDQGRIEGGTISVADACTAAAELVATPDDDVDWSAEDDLTPGKVTDVSVALTAKYCQEVSPRYEFRAVELETKPLEIDCGNGVVVRLTGQLDRSRLLVGQQGLGIADLKSGAQAVQKGTAKTKGHAAQVGTYELLYEHTTGERITEPAEIIGLKTTGKPEVAVGQIVGARQMMVGGEDGPGLIEYAAEMFRSGLFPPNPASMMCHPKYCARWAKCKFKDGAAE